MVARISIGSHEIRSAFRSCGGSVGIAARKLGISTKTLRRRLAEDPTLRPKPSMQDAFRRTWYESDPQTGEMHAITYELWRRGPNEEMPRELPIEEQQLLL